MKTFKILIIDDSDVLCAAIKKFFENYNFDVLTSNNGIDGIKLTTREKPDMIFLDLMMPNFGGIDFLKSVRVLENCQDIPIIVITSIQEGELIDSAKKLGATQILSKPLRRTDVFKAVDEILGDHTLSKIQHEKLFSTDEHKNESGSEKPINKFQIKNHLVKVFLKTIDKRIAFIKSTLAVKNEVALKSEMHELKGIGPMIGYTRLTLLGEYIEDLLKKKLTEAQWEEIKTETELVLDLLEQIKKEN